METTTAKTILLIDDDVEFTNTLSKKFQDAGLNVYVAVSGQEALNYIESHSVDFIILDFIMPEMDGFEFYHALKRDMRKNIPTIVLTNLSGTKQNEDLEVYVKTETDLDSLVGKVKDRVNSASSQ